MSNKKIIWNAHHLAPNDAVIEEADIPFEDSDIIDESQVWDDALDFDEDEVETQEDKEQT